MVHYSAVLVCVGVLVIWLCSLFCALFILVIVFFAGHVLILLCAFVFFVSVYFDCFFIV